MKTSTIIAVAAIALTAALLAAPYVDIGAALQHPASVFAAGLAIPPALLRGTALVRADTSDPKVLLAELTKAWADFRTENDKELADIKKKMGDVVQTEKVDRINAAVGDLQSKVDEVNRSVAALQVGAGGGGERKPRSADSIAHSAAFAKYFRKGVDAGLRELEVKAAMSTDSDPDGGYLVPEEESAAIERILSTVSVMRQLATVMSVGSSVYKKLVGQGGAGYGWVGEKEARPATATPTLSELQFPVMELYANPAATQSVLDDSRIDIAAWLANEIDMVFAEGEGAAFISGNGVQKPRGITAYTTVADASWAWGKIGFKVTGVAADINDATHNGADAFIDLVYSLKQGYRTNARFLMNRTLQGKARKLKAISTAIEEYIWQPSFQAGQPATILGYPVSDDDNMPDVGAGAFPVAFGDFRRGYLIVDRTGIRVLRDPYTNKPYVHFYTTKRVGGGVQNFEAIKLLKCST